MNFTPNTQEVKANIEQKLSRLFGTTAADASREQMYKAVAQTVKDILAKSTRPKGFEGYSLGLKAPAVDGEDQWFGHGGAWGTNCMVNWHRKELKLWAVQLCGSPRPWDKAREEAAKKFFKYASDDSISKAYTGRTK